ncbi:M20 family metallopeptidase [Frigidibacter sp. MR17.24]|uniref:M20 family metallopeptidase n=1 Tax=Frigidibacter sp. MR17.24 TaxID=3127345 RepID=UPI003012CE43
MNADEARMMNYLAEHEGEAIDLLERIVNIDSGSYDKAGVDAVGEAIMGFVAAQGIQTGREALDTAGDAFTARLPGTTNGAHLLLMGHRDTVFKTGEAKVRPYTVKDGRAYGPGVADMKAGLAMNALVMTAFAKLGLPHPPLVMLVTGDEEIGTPASRPAIEAAARGARAVFNAEPGRVSGNVVTGRRGGIFFRAAFTGRAAHAGLDYEYGRSAILALARKIEAWTALTTKDPDVSVNVGLVSGGLSVNTVAPVAACEIDLRYGNPADRDGLIAKIMAVAAEISVEDTTCTVEIIGEFLPVVTTPEQDTVLALYTGAAAQAGLTLTGEFTRSCADSGITAALGVPTICATGPVGGRAHSDEEYLELTTFLPRAQALALSILRLAEGPDA